MAPHTRFLTVLPADQRYDNAYLFGAICPARGVGAALALPYADADMMQLHLDEISRNVEVKLQDRKSTRLNSSHLKLSRMPSSA